MKFGYTIVYVPDVKASLVFFEKAFGLTRRFLHEAGDYGELETGATTLAFASHGLGDSNFASGVVRASESDRPLGMEIGLVTDDVAKAHKTAPTTKPWGQTVSYLRCPAGTLVELCTPVG